MNVPDGSLVPANALLTVNEVKKNGVPLLKVSNEWISKIARAIN